MSNSLTDLQAIQSLNHHGPYDHRDRQGSASGEDAPQRQVLEDSEARVQRNQLFTQPHQHGGTSCEASNQATVLSRPVAREPFTQIT